MKRHNARPKFFPLFIFFIIVFAGTVVAQKEKIEIEGQIWVDGIYAKYTLNYIIVNLTAHKDEQKSGTLEFHVVDNKLSVEIYGSDIPHRVLKFNIKNDKTYYNGEEVILPFFYRGEQIANYDGEYVKETKTREITLVNQKGILHGRPALYVEAEAIYKEGNTTESAQNIYEFGESSHLLFNGFLGYSILINGLFNIRSAFNIRLLLEDTNIKLASPNKGLVYSYYLYIACPVIVIIAIFVIFAYLYRRNYRRHYNAGYSNKRPGKKVR